MEKKNTGLIFVIVILALVVGLLGGYIIDNKLIDKQPNQTENNDNKNNGKDDNHRGQVDEPVEKEYSLADAEKLMNDYKFSLDESESSYITELTNTEMLKLIIFKTNTSKKVKCEQIKNELFNSLNQNLATAYFDQCQYDETNKGDRIIYSKNEILKTKNDLFGTSKTLDFISFDVDLTKYFYSKSLNGFVPLDFPSGYGAVFNAKCGLKSAKLVNTDLEIIAYNTTWTNDDEPTTKTYKYTFKQENNNYYLTDITEVK